jgi:hypothetical protein
MICRLSALLRPSKVAPLWALLLRRYTIAAPGIPAALRMGDPRHDEPQRALLAQFCRLRSGDVDGKSTSAGRHTAFDRRYATWTAQMRGLNSVAVDLPARFPSRLICC